MGELRWSLQKKTREDQRDQGMSKMNLEKHVEELKNSRQYICRKQEELERLQDEIFRLQLSADFKEHQISKAKELGKDGFDSDKFLKLERENRGVFAKEVDLEKRKRLIGI